MKTLPKLSEYILKFRENTDGGYSCHLEYCKFLTQPLNLSHFVPAIEKDGKWIVLKEPKSYDIWVRLHTSSGSTIGFTEYEQYQAALDNVVFKGVEVRMNNDFFSVGKDGKTLFDVFGNKNIESIIKYNLEVTDNIIKKFNL